ncbi:hypothetical protein [Paenibacillus tengchongensis]|nr:hypothetical protein [Paenibacillus tengchongensis]
MEVIYTVISASLSAVSAAYWIPWALIAVGALLLLLLWAVFRKLD